MRFPVAREGYPFIFPVLGAGVLFFVLGWKCLGTISILLGLFVIYFFRDPERTIPDGQSLLVSPADGKVVSIKKAENDPLGENITQISIFLSVFNVHINRSIMQGEVVSVNYNKGKFLAAFAEKASLLNEQNSVTIKNKDMTVRVNQIAGLIARRIVCWVKSEQLLQRGERFGLIRFGSRVDIFLPNTVAVKVALGDKVVGGVSIIGTVGDTAKQ